MDYLLCRHIKTNGLQCQSPALNEETFCFFHNRLHARHAAFRHTEATRGYLLPGQHIELAPLEDRESVQVALSVVINALATGRLDSKRATAILYGLQLASNNAATLRLEPAARSLVQTAEATPDGLDLADPGATGHISGVEDIYDLADMEEEEEDEDNNDEDDNAEDADGDDPTASFADQGRAICRRFAHEHATEPEAWATPTAHHTLPPQAKTG